jgi:hypothetical protein
VGILILLEKAREAKLVVELLGDRLKVTGPADAAPLVKAIAARKEEVIEHLSAINLPPCTRCGNPYYNLVAIHNGQSSRRDCARCKLTAEYPHSFPMWNGISAARNE